ncbi:MAG: hypothetical protein IJ312_07570 [Treponema sp.]|nr:hypothetical protein [Treponema sp.]
MKNKKLLFLIFAMTICVLACSKQINKLEISDDNFLFNAIGFKKQYKVETYLRAFDVGVYFKQPISKDDIKLGMLEVSIVSENGQEQKIMLIPNVRFFYSDYKNNLVNRIYFETINLGNEQFVQELNVSLINSFSVPVESELLITNLGTELFFVQ